MAKLAFFKTECQSSRFLSIECRTSFGVIMISFMDGDRGSTFHREWTISSHKGGRELGEVGSLFGKVDLFFLLCNRFTESGTIGHALLEAKSLILMKAYPYSMESR